MIKNIHKYIYIFTLTYIQKGVHTTNQIFTYTQLPRSLAEVQTWTIH